MYDLEASTATRREEIHLLVINPKNKMEDSDEVQHFSLTNQGFYLAASKAHKTQTRLEQIHINEQSPKNKR